MKSLLDFPRQTFLFPIAFVIFMILPAYDFPIWFFLRLSYDLWPPVSRVSENLFCPSVYSSKVRTNKTSMRMMVIGNGIIFARLENALFRDCLTQALGILTPAPPLPQRNLSLAPPRGKIKTARTLFYYCLTRISIKSFSKTKLWAQKLSPSGAGGGTPCFC